jgi:hypothetical protein
MYPCGFPLTPRSYTLASSIDKSNDLSTISILSKIASGESLTTKNGKNLKDLEWHIDLHRHRTTTQRISAADGIGCVMYSEEIESEYDLDVSPECIFLWAAIGDHQFDQLRDALLNGRSISTIHANVISQHITYDFHPDGSGKIWDVSKEKSAVLTGINWSVELSSHSDNEVNTDVLEHQNTFPATSNNIDDLRRSVQLSLNTLYKRLGLILLTLVIATLAFIWRVLHLLGKIAVRLIWKYMPESRLHSLLLRESDPFAEKSGAPARSAQAQRCRRPCQ